MIKYPKDKNGEITTQWPPTFKFKLPFINGEYKFEMYDKSNKKIDPKSVQTKGARAVAILKCNGIWLAGGKFGMSWKAEQIQIVPQNKIEGFCIRYVKEDMINQKDEVESTAVNNKVFKEVDNSSFVKEEQIEDIKTTTEEKDELEPDSEDELEPDSEDELEPKQEPEPKLEPKQEPEPEPEPEPVRPKKKIVKKKVVA